MSCVSAVTLLSMDSPFPPMASTLHLSKDKSPNLARDIDPYSMKSSSNASLNVGSVGSRLGSPNRSPFARQDHDLAVSTPTPAPRLRRSKKQDDLAVKPLVGQPLPVLSPTIRPITNTQLRVYVAPQSSSDQSKSEPSNSESHNSGMFQKEPLQPKSPNEATGSPASPPETLKNGIDVNGAAKNNKSDSNPPRPASKSSRPFSRSSARSTKHTTKGSENPGKSAAAAQSSKKDRKATAKSSDKDLEITEDNNKVLNAENTGKNLNTDSGRTTQPPRKLRKKLTKARTPSRPRSPPPPPAPESRNEDLPSKLALPALPSDIAPLDDVIPALDSEEAALDSSNGSTSNTTANPESKNAIDPALDNVVDSALDLAKLGPAPPVPARKLRPKPSTEYQTAINGQTPELTPTSPFDASSTPLPAGLQHMSPSNIPITVDATPPTPAPAATFGHASLPGSASNNSAAASEAAALPSLTAASAQDIIEAQKPAHIPAQASSPAHHDASSGLPTKSNPSAGPTEPQTLIPSPPPTSTSVVAHGSGPSNVPVQHLPRPARPHPATAIVAAHKAQAEAKARAQARARVRAHPLARPPRAVPPSPPADWFRRAGPSLRRVVSTASDTAADFHGSFTFAPESTNNNRQSSDLAAATRDDSAEYHGSSGASTNLSCDYSSSPSTLPEHAQSSSPSTAPDLHANSSPLTASLSHAKSSPANVSDGHDCTSASGLADRANSLQHSACTDLVPPSRARERLSRNVAAGPDVYDENWSTTTPRSFSADTPRAGEHFSGIASRSPIAFSEGSAWIPSTTHHGWVQRTGPFNTGSAGTRQIRREVSTPARLRMAPSPTLSIWERWSPTPGWVSPSATSPIVASPVAGSPVAASPTLPSPAATLAGRPSRMPSRAENRVARAAALNAISPLTRTSFRDVPAQFQESPTLNSPSPDERFPESSQRGGLIRPGRTSPFPHAHPHVLALSQSHGPSSSPASATSVGSSGTIVHRRTGAQEKPRGFYLNYPPSQRPRTPPGADDPVVFASPETPPVYESQQPRHRRTSSAPSSASPSRTPFAPDHTPHTSGLPLGSPHYHTAGFARGKVLYGSEMHRNALESAERDSPVSPLSPSGRASRLFFHDGDRERLDGLREAAFESPRTSPGLRLLEKTNMLRPGSAGSISLSANADAIAGPKTAGMIPDPSWGSGLKAAPHFTNISGHRGSMTGPMSAPLVASTSFAAAVEAARRGPFVVPRKPVDRSSAISTAAAACPSSGVEAVASTAPTAIASSSNTQASSARLSSPFPLPEPLFSRPPSDQSHDFSEDSRRNSRAPSQPPSHGSPTVVRRELPPRKAALRSSTLSQARRGSSSAAPDARSSKYSTASQDVRSSRYSAASLYYRPERFSGGSFGGRSSLSTAPPANRGSLHGPDPLRSTPPGGEPSFMTAHSTTSSTDSTIDMGIDDAEHDRKDEAPEPRNNIRVVSAAVPPAPVDVARPTIRTVIDLDRKVLPPLPQEAQAAAAAHSQQPQDRPRRQSSGRALGGGPRTQASTRRSSVASGTQLYQDSGIQISRRASLFRDSLPPWARYFLSHPLMRAAISRQERGSPSESPSPSLSPSLPPLPDCASSLEAGSSTSSKHPASQSATQNIHNYPFQIPPRQASLFAFHSTSAEESQDHLSHGAKTSRHANRSPSVYYSHSNVHLPGDDRPGSRRRHTFDSIPASDLLAAVPLPANERSARQRAKRHTVAIDPHDEKGLSRLRPDDAWSPRLYQGRESMMKRRSGFATPVWDEAALAGTTGLKRRNWQVWCFAIGFLCPFAWIAAAVLPLPPHPHTPPSSPLFEYDLECTLGPADLAVYENARWWRICNRVMSVVGVCIVVAVIVLCVIASRAS